MKIGIIDYGMGNLQSVHNAFFFLGHSAYITEKPEEISSFDALVLPGVGAFPQAIDKLNSSHLSIAIKEFLLTGKPFLGICLGMQLMCKSSIEGEHKEGLGIFNTAITPFVPSIRQKVPHMGWNNLNFLNSDKLFANIANESDVYFLHSFYAELNTAEDTIASSEYGVHFSSILKKNNAIGMQFHPEKSQRTGLTLLKNFLNIC